MVFHEAKVYAICSPHEQSATKRRKQTWSPFARRSSFGARTAAFGRFPARRISFGARTAANGGPPATCIRNGAPTAANGGPPATCIRNQFRGSNSCERRASRQAHQFRGLNCYVRQVSRQAQQKRCPNSCVQRTEHVTARTHAPAPATREALLPHKASSKKRTRRKTRKSRNAHTIRDKRPTGSEFPRDACVAWERAPPRHAPRPHGPARLLSEHSSRMSAGPCGRGRAWAGPEPIRARRRPYRAGSTFRGPQSAHHACPSR